MHGYGKNWNPSQHYQDSAIAAKYDRVRFSGLAGRAFNWLEKRLVRRAFSDLARDCKVIDVPCGTGRLAEVLLEMGFHVTGLDISSQMLAVAAHRLRRFDKCFAPTALDARQLAPTELRFEAALCARVLMHFPLEEQISFLRNVATVTRRRVVFTQGVNTRLHRLRRRIKRLLGHQASAVYSLTPADIQTLITAAGLRELHRYALFPVLSESFVFVCEPVP